MNLTIEDIAKAVGGKILSGNPETVITGVSTDSRTIKPGDLFIALRGDKHDGHDHLYQVFENGAAAAIVDRETNDGMKVVRVDDTLKALGDLAQFWRNRFSVRVVAVTGSNGKTTTKDMIAALLSKKYRVLKTEGNFNNLIGLPHTVFKMDEKTQVAILEMGMNHPGEIRRLTSIAHPEVGVITNVARAHLEGLGTLVEVAKAKAELLEGLPQEGVAILNEATPSYRLLKKFLRSPLKTVGKASGIKATLSETSFVTKVGKKKVTFRMPILGKHNVSNALMAIAVGDYFGVPVAKMQAALKNLQAGSKRMEVVSAGQKINIINDCYNANPDSMVAGLEYLKDSAGKKRKVAILGDMFELGAESGKMHGELGQKAAGAKVGLLIAIGPHAADVVRGARRGKLSSERAFFFETVDAAIPVILALIRPGDLILVKGSRGMKMETITETLKNVL
jgi:UDP-N-acetylmuramoyl-tripeptide--D-alanyl-D-alanine ligase